MESFVYGQSGAIYRGDRIAVDGEVAHSNAGACMRRGSRSWLGEGGGKLE